jgi:hypothetical protein
MSGIQMSFTLGNIVTIATVLGAVLFIYHKALKPILMFMDEHNLMWEDYSIRHYLPYRMHLGRVAGLARVVHKESRDDPKP